MIRRSCDSFGGPQQSQRRESANLRLQIVHCTLLERASKTRPHVICGIEQQQLVASIKFPARCSLIWNGRFGGGALEGPLSEGCPLLLILVLILILYHGRRFPEQSRHGALAKAVSLPDSSRSSSADKVPLQFCCTPIQWAASLWGQFQLATRGRLPVLWRACFQYFFRFP